jgi:CIC family chloride channel protein
MRVNIVRGVAWFRLALRRRFRQDDRAYGIVLTLAVGALGALAAVGVRYVGLAVQWIVLDAHERPRRAGDRVQSRADPAAGGVLYTLSSGCSAPPRREPRDHGGGVAWPARPTSGSVKSVASVVPGAMGLRRARGPIVQLASAGASRLAQALRVPRAEARAHRRGGGDGGGVQRAIGAAMFVMESSTETSLEIFRPVVLASVTATHGLVGRSDHAALPVPLVPAPALVALPLFALLGALVAWTGLVFRGAVEVAERFFKRIPLPLEARAASGGLVVGLLAWWIPEVWGNGYDGVREVLAGMIAPAVLIPLLIAKIAATSSSLGSGGSGGVFTPALLIGAAAGGVFGLGAEIVLPGLHVAPVFFVLAGMTAAIASTTFAPITAMIMVFEMCQNYGAVMPLAVVTVTATWVARGLRRDSIYTESLRRRGIDFDVAFERMALASLRAEDLIRTNLLTVGADAPVSGSALARSRGAAVYVARRRLVSARLRDVPGRGRLGATASRRSICGDVRASAATPLDGPRRCSSSWRGCPSPSTTPTTSSGASHADVVSALDRGGAQAAHAAGPVPSANVPSEFGGGAAISP